MKVNFFSVSLKENIPILERSIPILDDFYKYDNYTVICPADSVELFKNAFSIYRNVDVVNENEVLTYADFLSVVEKLRLPENLLDKARLKWYYQQLLKLVFALKNSSKDENIVMWDADTIPIRPILFFDGSSSLNYGSLIEYNELYFDTIASLFDLPRPRYAFTIQFFSLTPHEREVLLNRFLNARKFYGSEKIATILTEVAICSIIDAHGKLTSSLLSEQELVGVSNFASSKAEQEPLLHFRVRFVKNLTEMQCAILRRFGYAHVTFEGVKNKKTSFFIFVPILLVDWIRQKIFNYFFFNIRWYFRNFQSYVQSRLMG